MRCMDVGEKVDPEYFRRPVMPLSVIWRMGRDVPPSVTSLGGGIVLVVMERLLVGALRGDMDVRSLGRISCLGVFKRWRVVVEV